MLLLKPLAVTFGGVAWRAVKSVAVARTAVRTLAEHGDGGPHPVFVDVPSQRTRITITSELGGEDLAPPALGASATIVVRVARAGTDAGLCELRALVAVLGVSYRLGQTAERVVELEAVSLNGAADPVAVVPLDE
ncbi:MAG: hypothetical protein ACOYN0_06880 [Phycisphaerales bacterium]